MTNLLGILIIAVNVKAKEDDIGVYIWFMGKHGGSLSLRSATGKHTPKGELLGLDVNGVLLHSEPILGLAFFL